MNQPPSTEPHRERHVTGAFGLPGMGKSWLADYYKQQFRKYNPEAPIYSIGKRVPFGFFPRGADHGDKDAVEALFEYIKKITNDGMGPRGDGTDPMVGLDGAFVELDDADGFLPSRVRGTPFHSLFNEARHNRTDVFFTAHRPATIDKNVLGACHHLFFFNLGEVHAWAYFEEIPEVQAAIATLGNRRPKAKGEVIHVIQDPEHRAPVRADFLNLYRSAA